MAQSGDKSVQRRQHFGRKYQYSGAQQCGGRRCRSRLRRYCGKRLLSSDQQRGLADIDWDEWRSLRERGSQRRPGCILSTERKGTPSHKPVACLRLCEWLHRHIRKYRPERKSELQYRWAAGHEWLSWICEWQSRGAIWKCLGQFKDYAAAVEFEYQYSDHHGVG